MKKSLLYFSFIALILAFNCSKDEPDPIPTSATLLFPDNNQECNEGTSVNPTQTSITFRWNASTNTNSYDLFLKNLNTQTTVITNSTTNSLSIIINKGTPYSWYVVSKSETFPQTAESEIWKFYNAGDAIESHPPFPADLISPLSSDNIIGITTQTLTWQGSDVDNDIVNYDVYFGTTPNPSTLLRNTTITNTDVTVAAGNTYYWRVITIDSEGNSSESEIFQFRVN